MSMSLRTVAVSVLLFGAVAGVGVGGCGDKMAPVEPVDLTQFVGTWNVVAATLTVTCSNNFNDALTVTDPLIFTLGAGFDLANTGPVCPLRYDVVGHTASALPGQTCDNPDVITTMHFDTDTFATSDGMIGAHHSTGALTQYNDISQGNPVRCTFVAEGAYQRAMP
jgi:hypothetical protein